MGYQEIYPMDINENWNLINIQESNESLVSIQSINSEKIIVKPMYFIHGIEGALPECYVREGVARLLVEAAKLLPKGHNFIVYDGWRPFSVQSSLYNEYTRKITNQYPSLSALEISNLVKTFVSKPSLNEKSPAPHFTGGSVDITIGIGNQPLNMGTLFDDFSNKSKTRYYEELIIHTKEEKEALENRRLLFHTLVSVGFSSYTEEWWHFDYGNQWWASAYKKETAIYGLIYDRGRLI